MRKLLEVGLIISAYDKATRVINEVTRNAGRQIAELEKKQRNAQSNMLAGTATMAAGAGIIASMAPAVQAYEDLEDSSAALRSSMLMDGGIVSKNFAQVNKIAEQLGNKLPGTTKDFQAMMIALNRGGVSQVSVINGVGKAAAYLGVALKMPYEDAARMAAKLKEATGTADGEMLRFMDTIQRVVNVGVDATEMQYAFARSGGQLKLLGIQGLAASKSISAVYAALIRGGASGETVGTNMASLMDSMMDSSKLAKLDAATKEFGITMSFVDKKTGQFKGVENMVAQFDKLKGLNPTQRGDIVRAFVGPGTDSRFMNTLIDGGTSKFNEINKAMSEQATLTQKVTEQLKTLKAVKESAAGTFENMLAAIGGSIGPELKAIAEGFGKLSAKIQEFAASNPRFFKFIGIMIAFAGMATMMVGAFLVIKGAIMAVSAAFAIMGVASLAAFWWVAAIVAAVALIYVYWGPITKFFANMWEQVKIIFKNVVTSLFGKGFFDQFFKAGTSIPKMIAGGIIAMIGLPYAAMLKVVSKVRKLLPFSPAKEGPFMDLHKTKIVETLVSGMKPGPMVAAMAGVTGAGMKTANAAGLGRSGSGGGGNTAIHFSPVINVSGPAAKSDLQAATHELKRQFHQWYAEAQRSGQRVNYAPA